MRRIAVFAAVVVAVAAFAAVAHGLGFGGWSAAVNLEANGGADDAVNTAALEGCPSISRDGLRLFFASSRAGHGGLDIYVSTRTSTEDPWGAPVNVDAVNTSADEFCPTPLRDGQGLLFVSTRTGGCGGADIYRSRESPRGWSAPENVGCDVNSAKDEASPFLVGDELYFSSTRSGTSQIYVVPFAPGGGAIGVPEVAPGLGSSSSDARPNLRRDGLEIFFDSNRGGGCGGVDLWTSTRDTRSDAWSAPTNVGCNVNSPQNDLRPSLSWDGTHLYFGSTRSSSEGSQDLYVTTREKLTGSS
jgi:Tol biopolymer transport system component